MYVSALSSPLARRHGGAAGGAVPGCCPPWAVWASHSRPQYGAVQNGSWRRSGPLAARELLISPRKGCRPSASRKDGGDPDDEPPKIVNQLEQTIRRKQGELEKVITGLPGGVGPRKQRLKRLRALIVCCLGLAAVALPTALPHQLSLSLPLCPQPHDSLFALRRAGNGDTGRAHAKQH